MNNKDNKFNNKAFKAILSRYQKAQNGLGDTFFDLDELIDVAEYYYEEGDLQQAKKVARYSLRLYPGAMEPLALLARMAMLHDNDLAKAKALAAKVDDKENLEYYYLMAEIMIMEDDIDKADTYLESKLHVLDGDDLYDFLVEVPALFLDYNLPELAQKWMRRIEEKDTPDYQELEAKVAFSNGEYQVSENILHRLLDDEPFSTELWNCMASAQYMLNKIHESMESSEYAIAINPHDKDALLNKANCLVALYEHEKANEYYKRYLDLFPNDSNTRMLYGVSLASAGRYDEAQDNLSRVERESKDAALVSSVVKELAIVMFNQGKGDEAILYLDGAESGSRITHIDRMLTEGYIRLGQYRDQEANDCFLDALINAHSSFEVYLQVMFSYFDFAFYQRVYDMMLPYLSKPTPDPEIKEGYAYMAYACRMLNKHDELMRYMELACQINPYEARMVLGRLFPDDCPVSNYVNYARQHNL